MKKWLTFLLLLVTFTGTFFPCCLVDGCNDEEAATAQNKNNKQPEGTCSPFFACTTCPGSVELSKPIRIDQPIFDKQIHHAPIVKFNLTTYASGFWQPPRFS